MKSIFHYRAACIDVLKEFSKKQDLEFDGWVGNEVGGIASFCMQYFFTMEDMCTDLVSKQKKGFILQWQNEGVEYCLGNKEEKHINYKSYIKGARYNEQP